MAYTWTQKRPYGKWSDCAMSADGSKMVVCGHVDTLINCSNIYTSTDGGLNFTERFPLPRNQMFPNDPAGVNPYWNCCAISDNGLKIVCSGIIYTLPTETTGTFYSADGGETWTNDTEQFAEISCSSNGNYLIATHYDQCWISSDSGTTWTELVGVSTGWRAPAISGNGSFQALTDGWNLYVSTDYGVSWTSVGEPKDYYISCAISGDGSAIITVVYGGYIYYSTDFGINWTEITALSTRYWNKCAISYNGTKLFVSGNSSAVSFVYGSWDSGSTWSNLTSPDLLLNDFKISSNSNRVIVVKYLTTEEYVLIGNLTPHVPCTMLEFR